jgi:hypothetical protein
MLKAAAVVRCFLYKPFVFFFHAEAKLTGVAAVADS